tara:strand:+ start:103 stop:597 length:495 start_codon:yes stop_codon:yes gene_type:complete
MKCIRCGDMVDIFPKSKKYCFPCNRSITNASARERYSNGKRKEYNKKNKEAIRAYDKAYQPKRAPYMRERLKDVNTRLLHNLRVRIYKAVKFQIKNSSAIESLGCEIDFYRKYIENKWTEGMCWDNYGMWEIDHILPVSKGGSFHYKNTQPLWLVENRKKSNKI